MDPRNSRQARQGSITRGNHSATNPPQHITLPARTRVRWPSRRTPNQRRAGRAAAQGGRNACAAPRIVPCSVGFAYHGHQTRRRGCEQAVLKASGNRPGEHQQGGSAHRSGAMLTPIPNSPDVSGRAARCVARSDRTESPAPARRSHRSGRTASPAPCSPRRTPCGWSGRTTV